MELYQQGRSQYQPKITSETTRKIWLDVITWKYDFIQQYKKRCFQFAEAVIIRIALREQEVNGKNDELAWNVIYMFKYGVSSDKVPAPWYDKVGGAKE